MRQLSVFVLICCVASNSSAQSRSDSSAVLKSALLYYAERAEPRIIGVVPNTLTGMGSRYSDRRPDAMPAAIAASPRLRAAPVFDSIPRLCGAEADKSYPLNASVFATPSTVCLFRDIDGVVSVSNPVIDGQKATLYLRQNVSLKVRNVPHGTYMSVWLYNMEFRSGSWVVISTKIIVQS